MQVALYAGLPHDDDDRVPVEAFSDVAAAALASVADRLVGLVLQRRADARTRTGNRSITRRTTRACWAVDA